MSTYADRDGTLWVKVESSEGVDPTLAATDARYVEEAAVTAQREIIVRAGKSGHRPGHKPIVGPQKATWTVKTEITPVVVTGSGDLPLEDAWLQALGFTAAYAAGPPKVRVYTLASRPTASVAIETYEHNDANDAGWSIQLRGCRADGSMEFTGDERWFLNLTGEAASYARTAVGARDTITYDFDTNPVVGGAGECQIIALLSDLGGSDETYPMASGRLVSANIALNNGVNLKRGVCGQRVGVDPATAPTMDLVLEVQDDTDFDPWQYQGNTATGTTQVPILVCIGSPDLSWTAATGIPVDPGTGVSVRFYGFITSIAEGAADAGAKVWTLSLTGAWPETGTPQPAGEVPAAGIVVITYATVS